LTEREEKRIDVDLEKKKFLNRRRCCDERRNVTKERKKMKNHHYRRTYLSNGSAHETKTKIGEPNRFTVRFFAFKVGRRCPVGKSLRKFLTALELLKKIIEETPTDFLSACCLTSGVPVHQKFDFSISIGSSLSESLIHIQN
jgi:hypothetical protein